MMSSQGKYSMSMPNPPPTDINSYTRLMHQHTMRQMEEMHKAAQQGHHHDSTGSRQAPHTFSPTSAPNGSAQRT